MEPALSQETPWPWASNQTFPHPKTPGGGGLETRLRPTSALGSRTPSPKLTFRFSTPRRTRAPSGQLRDPHPRGEGLQRGCRSGAPASLFQLVPNLGLRETREIQGSVSPPWVSKGCGKRFPEPSPMTVPNKNTPNSHVVHDLANCQNYGRDTVATRRSCQPVALLDIYFSLSLAWQSGMLWHS